MYYVADDVYSLYFFLYASLCTLVNLCVCGILAKCGLGHNFLTGSGKWDFFSGVIQVISFPVLMPWREKSFCQDNHLVILIFFPSVETYKTKNK